MGAEFFQVLWVPGCFLGAGLLGLRLGTPRRVAHGLIVLGAAHALGVLSSRQALAADGLTRDAVHLGSQLLFAAGFGALVWLAACYPYARPSRRIVGATAALVVIGPLVGALSGPTATVWQPDGATTELGPLVRLLPASLAGVALAPVMLLPLLAVGVFVARMLKAGTDDRTAMRWPVTAATLLAVIAVAGNLLQPAYADAGSLAFLVAGPLLPLALAFGPVRRRLRTLTDDLATRVAELEESRHRLSVAAEEERRRLERDLHDGAQQEMLGLLSQLELARASDDPAVRERALDQAAELGRAAYDTVRAIAHGVRPASLDDLGLGEALRGVVRGFPMPVELVVDEVPRGALAPDAEAAALFTVSEALANVLRHAQATRVRLHVSAAAGSVTVTVEDDGVGGADAAGRGLRGIRDRVEASGGHLEMSSAAGCTRLAARFPAAVRTSQERR